jgi:hypothetical protein
VQGQVQHLASQAVEVVVAEVLVQVEAAEAAGAVVVNLSITSIPEGDILEIVETETIVIVVETAVETAVEMLLMMSSTLNRLVAHRIHLIYEIHCIGLNRSTMTVILTNTAEAEAGVVVGAEAGVGAEIEVEIEEGVGVVKGRGRGRRDERGASRYHDSGSKDKEKDGIRRKSNDRPPRPPSSNAAPAAAVRPQSGFASNINPDSFTVTVPLSDPRFTLLEPSRSDSIPFIPPTAPAPAPHSHNHQQHPPSSHQKMAFVIPASISEIPKAARPESASNPRKKKYSFSPRPVFVPGDGADQDQDQSLLQSQPSASISEAPSGAWHQVVSPTKRPPSSTGKNKPPPNYQGNGNNSNGGAAG